MYSVFSEQFRDYERLLCVYLSEYMDRVVRAKSVTDTPFEKYKGLVISLEEAENVFSSSSFALSEQGEQAVSEIWSEIAESSAESQQNGVFLPLDSMCRAFGFGMLERFIIALAALPLINPEYERSFGYICDNVRATAPTLSLALDLFAHGDISRIRALSAKLLKYVFQPYDGNPLQTPLKFRPYFQRLLSCGEFPESRIFNTAYPAEPGMICYAEQFSLMEQAVELPGERIICVCGEKGSGRKHLVRQLGAKLNRAVLFVDIAEFTSADKSSAELDIICELLMKQCLVCVAGITVDSDNTAVSELVGVLFRAAKTVFLCADSPASIPETEQPQLCVKLGELSRDTRHRLWLATGICGVELAQTAANKFRFDPSRIFGSAAHIKEEMQARRMTALTEELLDEICSRTAENAFGGKAALISSQFTMDDLILPEEEKQQILEACAQIKFRHIVYDRWNFESRLAYGKGLSILFAGPPGTGKTMAATIVARELGLPVYRVDISQVMSKYIGETEKSLGEIFNAAEKCSAILFFDETDALFGKRSEIKDSHDKYANVETSFLLQRLESFNGIVLMATNLIQNIDEAFIRRISCVVNFPLPDAPHRLILWKNMFPDEMPRDPGIDFDYLAEQFELSGASIKNSVMSAAFLAAEEGSSVNMSHIIRAVKKQLAKQGKVLLKDDFGKYSVYL